jgi:glycosyltransferase involved in cell wall biosynthesis
MKRVLIATDAAHPQINGVVRTLEATRATLERLGVEVDMATPADHASIPMPFYPEIRLALVGQADIARRIERFRPDAIHVATEGPIGHAARAHCLARGLPFTTAYHTRFPEYLAARAPVPEEWSYAWLRRFHGAARRTLVATASIETELAARGFRHLARWARGVDTALFSPDHAGDMPWPRPIFLSVGRVAVEKNLEAFLSLDLPGTKLVVGEGPDRAMLASRYPGAVFLGAKTGADLSALYAGADVFVFPSKTDTFGNVMLEALASGTPVAAYPVPGPIDILRRDVGVTDGDLLRACFAALRLDRRACRRHALGWTWEACTRRFLDHLAPIAGEPRRAA